MSKGIGRQYAEFPVLFLLVFTLSWSGCREPLEACLDVRASNYTAAADRNCCCEWPRLSFAVEHLAMENIHSPVDTYFTSNGQAYRLLSMDFVLSDFQLHFRDQQVVTMMDSFILAGDAGGMHWVHDDITVLTRDASSFSPGRFIGMGELDSVSFLLGLPESVREATPDDFPESHPFRLAGAERWEAASGYTMARAWILSIPAGDTLQWTLRESKRIVLPVEGFIQSGRSVSLGLKVDYDAWFRNQDLSPGSMPDLFWADQVISGFR